MVRDDSDGMYSELPASRAARSARLRSTKARRSSRVTPLQTTGPPKAFSSARAPMVSATNSCAKCGMTARAVGPTSAPSGSTGSSRQPRTVRPSSAARQATCPTRAARSASSTGRNATPTAYSPTGGSSKSTSARSRASGIWVRMPAPSPEFGSEPAAPRWSRLCRAVRPRATMARDLRPRASATKATPHASLSFAGSYRPAAGGAAENGTAAGTAENGTEVRASAEVRTAGAERSDMFLPSSAGTRTRPRGRTATGRPGGQWWAAVVPGVRGCVCSRAPRTTRHRKPSGRVSVRRSSTGRHWPGSDEGWTRSGSLAGPSRRVHRRNTRRSRAVACRGASRSGVARRVGIGAISLVSGERVGRLGAVGRGGRCGGRCGAGGVGGRAVPRCGLRRPPGDDLAGPAALPDEVSDGQHPDDDRGEDVQAQAEEVLGGVDAQRLDVPAPEAVEGDVQGERPPVAEPEPPVGPDDDAGGDQVPHQFVEERGVVGGDVLVAGEAVGRVDHQRPGQVGGLAVEFLVEVVPQPADGLGDEQAR